MNVTGTLMKKHGRKHTFEHKKGRKQKENATLREEVKRGKRILPKFHIPTVYWYGPQSTDSQSQRETAQHM